MKKSDEDSPYEYQGDGKPESDEEPDENTANVVKKKDLTKEEQLTLEATKNEAARRGVSTNEMIAMKRFLKAFSEIKPLRKDHYKCKAQVADLKHKLKVAKRNEDDATVNATLPELKEIKTVVCPAAQQALNDAVVEVKKLRKDLINVAKEATSDASTFDEVDEAKISALKEVAEHKLAYCSSSAYLTNLTEEGKDDEQIDNAQDDKKLDKLHVILAKAKFQKAEARGE